MAQRKENIVMFPFMAQGHILPFLALAHQIEQRKNYTITFINTPLNIKTLRLSLPKNSSIRLLEIPFNSTEFGLPPNSENTNTLSFPLIVQLLQTSHSFKPSFKKLISNLVQEQGHPPLCIISDMFFPWCAEVAHDFGIFHAIFNAGCGYGMASFHSLWSNLPYMKVDSNEFPLPGFPESSRIRVDQIPEHLRIAKSTDSWTVFINKVFNEWLESDGVLLNTVDEFDNIGLVYFRQRMNTPVWPVGPVNLSMGSEAYGGKESSIKWDHCKKWLDTKPSNSVLYISFGSQRTVSESQMMHLAMALEASGKNFIWVVRPPIEFDINSDFNAENWLPKGFEERIQNRGLLVQNWAPQLKILSHKSIGAFFSHCGWNSVLESLSNGVPLMAWPMIAEQHFNAKILVEEIGVCVQVAEGIGTEVRHDDMLQKIELVMNGTTEGKDMKRKAFEVSEMTKNAMKDEKSYKGSSVKAMDDFLHAAMLKRQPQKPFTDNGV